MAQNEAKKTCARDDSFLDVDAPLAPHHGPLEPLLGVARHRPLEALPRQLLDLPGGHHVVSLTVALYGIYVSAQAT